MAQERWTPDKIIALYSEGYEDIEVIRAMGTTSKKFYKAYASDPVFREVVDMGRDYALAWNVEQSRVKLNDKDFNTGLFRARMENLHGWSNKVENKNANINADIPTEEVLQRLGALLPSVGHLLPQEQREALAKLASPQNPAQAAVAWTEVSDD